MTPHCIGLDNFIHDFFLSELKTYVKFCKKGGLIPEGIPNLIQSLKCAKSMFRDNDFAHFFDVGTKLKIFSTILSHLYFFTDKTDTGVQRARVVYICVSLLLLAHESCDSSKAEKKLLLLQAEQIHKMTTMFTQNGQSRHFE